jgi:multidrug resistance efflux pump
MSFNEEQFKSLRRQVESTRAEAERAKGAMNQIKADLKKEFGCSTIKEAKAKLESIQEELRTAEFHLSQMMADYKSKWKQ